MTDELSLTDLGNILTKSGFFADTHDAAQAIVKVLAGRELGFGPIASMTGFHIIKGRVSMSANLIAAAVKRAGKYNFRVTELTDAACEIAFFEQNQEIGHSRFTLEDAKRAGTQNLDKFPRNMLYARAMSNGAKWFCADIFGGPIYTPEELGEPINEDGDVIEGHLHEFAPALPPTPETPASIEPPEPATATDGTPYADLPTDQLAFRANSLAKALRSNNLTAEQRAEKQAKLTEIQRVLKARNQ